MRSLPIVVSIVLVAGACTGPDTPNRQIPLAIDSDRLAVEWQDGPRREAAEANMRRQARRTAQALFRGEPMPTGAPRGAAPGGAVAEGVVELPEDDARPSWADGVPRPPDVLEHDLPRAWPVEVRRGETPELLARWAGTDARTILTDNADVLGTRRWLRTGDRLSISMSQNQKVAFDRTREGFQRERLDAYFARRYFEKVVVYRVKRGEYISNAAKRYGDVPLWLLEEFNQVDFRSLQPGDEVLIPVVATLTAGQKAPPPLRVVDEEGRPLSDERRDRVADRLRGDLIGRARMALDDSNVFERGQPSPRRAELLPDYLEVRAAQPASEDGAVEARGPASVARDIIVQPGETLLHYVQWSGVTVDAIRTVNPHLDPDRILVGARISLPLTDQQYVDFVRARAAWVRDGGARAEARQGAESSAPAPPVAPARTYVVVAGDTAGAIARRHQTTLAELRRVNGAVDLDRIRVGQALRLP